MTVVQGALWGPDVRGRYVAAPRVAARRLHTAYGAWRAAAEAAGIGTTTLWAIGRGLVRWCTPSTAAAIAAAVAELPPPGRTIHADDVAHFLGLGYSPHYVARRLAVELDSVRTAMRRQGRPDLADRLHETPA